MESDAEATRDALSSSQACALKAVRELEELRAENVELQEDSFNKSKMLRRQEMMLDEQRRERALSDTKLGEAQKEHKAKLEEFQVERTEWYSGPAAAVKVQQKKGSQHQQGSAGSSSSPDPALNAPVPKGGMRRSVIPGSGAPGLSQPASPAKPDSAGRGRIPNFVSDVGDTDDDGPVDMSLLFGHVDDPGWGLSKAERDYLDKKSPPRIPVPRIALDKLQALRANKGYGQHLNPFGF
jgi:hypothetical protein